MGILKIKKSVKSIHLKKLNLENECILTYIKSNKPHLIYNFQSPIDRDVLHRIFYFCINC